jgi:hypothetical protein
MVGRSLTASEAVAMGPTQLVMATATRPHPQRHVWSLAAHPREGPRSAPRDVPPDGGARGARVMRRGMCDPEDSALGIAVGLVVLEGGAARLLCCQGGREAV